MPQQQIPQGLDPTAFLLTKAIKQTETSGTADQYTAQGASGEYGAYQYTPATWAADSQKYLGTNVPLSQATPAQQNQVAYSKVKALLDAGNTQSQVAQIWNHGSVLQRGDTGIGTNSYGVAYDVPGYVNKVKNNYQQIQQQFGNQNQSQTPQPDSSGYITQPSLPAGTGTPAPAPSFLDSASNDISGTIGGVGNAISQTASGQINPVSGIIQGLGSVAGGANSLINDAATHLPVIGGVISGAEGLLGQGVNAAAQTAPGQAVTGAIQNFSQAHPELAGDIGGAANIAGLAGTLYGGGAALSAAKEGIESGVSSGVFGDALKAASDQRVSNDALDIVAPKQTAAVLKKAMKTGNVGPKGLAGKLVAPEDAATVAAGKAVEPLIKSGALSKSMDAYEQANVVNKEIATEAQSLRGQLNSLEIKPIVSQEDLSNLKTTLEQQMEDNFTLVGNSSLYGQKALQKFFSLLPKGQDLTAEDILDARQGLDRWALAQKGGKIFDPATANAQSEGLRIVRRGANNLIAEKAPDIAVKESLARQNALYNALDNITNKGYKEIGSTRIQRLAKKHPVASGLVRLAGQGAKTAAEVATGFKLGGL